MKQIMDSRQSLINDCGNGLVSLFYNEEETTVMEQVQTSEDGYEEKEANKYSYDYLELRGVGQPVTEANVLEAVREHVVELINGYDASENVNRFFLKVGETTVPYWLSRETRGNLSHSVTTWKNAGNSTYTLDLREYGTSVDMDCDKLLDMLSQLENYAVACYNVTSGHLNAVMDMTDIETVLNYDYTTGYPDKLTFDV